MKTITDILIEQAFFEGLSSEDVSFIAGCGKFVHFKEGEVIANPGDPADLFYLIRDGQVALSMKVPSKDPFIFQTLSENEILGLSWLIPPYRWTISAHATTPVRAIAFDGACLREKCEKDPRLGYKLMKHLVKVLVMREEAAFLHVLDIYG